MHVAPSLAHYRAAPLVAIAAGPQASIIYLLFMPYLERQPEPLRRPLPIKPPEDRDDTPRGETRLSLLGLLRLRTAIAPARPCPLASAAARAPARGC